jgi:aspartate kinase
MSISVLKFGGSSFRRLEDYPSVCEILLSRLKVAPSRGLVVVVSAMYGHTDCLLSAGRSLSPRMSGEASDALLTTGECISAALLKIALEDRGVKTAVLNGYRLGILSDSTFTQAGIRSVDATAIHRALSDVKVVVVTGAQAVDSQGRITMLGRNSSDLTAVALAAELGQDDCEIYSDVPGVYSADPYLFPKARLLGQLPHSQLVEMARSGAKVIHFGAAETARRSRVRIVCRATAQADRIGTVVSHDSPAANAVVLNSRILFFEFNSPSDLSAAEGRLSEWGVVSLRVSNSCHLLAVNQGVLSIDDFLCAIQIPFRQLNGHALLTVLRDSGEVERTMVNREEAQMRASHAHDELCGTASHGPEQRMPELAKGAQPESNPFQPPPFPWVAQSS